MSMKIDRRSAERIAKEVREHERRIRGRPEQKKNWPNGTSSNMQFGKVISDIDGRDRDDVIRFGQVNLYTLEDDKLILSDDETEVINVWRTKVIKDSIVLIGESDFGSVILGRECPSEIADDEDGQTA